jgi:hypothetical protein
MKTFLIAVIAVAIYSGRADAYPQFQMSKDQTCWGCHISPAGGGLLNENGLNTAEAISQFGTAPEFLNKLISTPDWLTLGGDFRGAYGYLQTPEKTFDPIPMQAELYANVRFGDFIVHLTAGARPPEYRNESATYFWSREHYVQWQTGAGDGELFVRVGRFMPVFGLRFAEHPDYIRRYGGTQLYSETYGAAVEFVKDKYEAHVTGFIKDPIIDPVAHDNGAAAYAEYRLTDKVAVGAEGMFTRSVDDQKVRGGITAKFLVAPNVLIQGEGQFVNQQIRGPNEAGQLEYGQGGAPNQLVAYLMGSWFVTDPIMVDVGLGHYDENIRIKNLDRDCVDLNVHWFTTSHIEMLLTGRIEVIGQTNGGPTGAYAFLQAHYRL